MSTPSRCMRRQRSDCSYSPVIEKKWMNSCEGTAVQIMLSHRYCTRPNARAQARSELIVTHFHLRKINTELWTRHLLRSRPLKARCEPTSSVKEPIFGSDLLHGRGFMAAQFTRQWEDCEVANGKTFSCSRFLQFRRLWFNFKIKMHFVSHHCL